jgi:hypothetical protein
MLIFFNHKFDGAFACSHRMMTYDNNDQQRKKLFIADKAM